MMHQTPPSVVNAGGRSLTGRARGRAETLDRILELPAAVVFIDEVDDLAPSATKGKGSTLA
jgi:hypothetical protein